MNDTLELRNELTQNQRSRNFTLKTIVLESPNNTTNLPYYTTWQICHGPCISYQSLSIVSTYNNNSYNNCWRVLKVKESTFCTCGDACPDNSFTLYYIHSVDLLVNRFRLIYLTESNKSKQVHVSNWRTNFRTPVSSFCSRDLCPVIDIDSGLRTRHFVSYQIWRRRLWKIKTSTYPGTWSVSGSTFREITPHTGN